MDKEKNYIRAGVVAQRLGVSVQTLRRWCEAGHMHRYKLNRSTVLFDEAEVEALVQRSCVTIGGVEA